MKNPLLSPILSIMKKNLDPCPMWNTIFAISFVIAVSMDPLFLYIPILDEKKKCLGMDRNLKPVALVLRCVTDMFYIMHIIFQFRIAFMAEHSGVSKRNGQLGKNNTSYLDIARRVRWSDILIDSLAILPVPQVLIIFYFSKTRSLRSLITSKFINFLVLIQYVPRVLRVYLSCEKLKTTPGLAQSRIVRFSAVLNFVLYIVASHIIGATWYFFSMERETACWHHACKKHHGCFICRSNYRYKYLSIVSRSCPTNPPNATVFDYGIFTDAIQSGILKKTSFLKKFIRCFWWGLRNVSSFGQNLQTSTDVWETCFAASISVTALLLFIYLIGNLQMYFQMATTRSKEIAQKMSRVEAEIDIWVRTHSLPATQKVQIMQQVQRAMEDDKDSFDLAILRSLLLDRVERINPNLIHGRTVESEVGLRPEGNSQLGITIKEQTNEQRLLRHGIPDHQTKLKHLCFSFLKRALMPRDLDDNFVERICDYLKPVIYPENSHIIQQGEPLNLMFFITEGVAWSYSGSNICGDVSKTAASRLEKGDFYGDKELIEWTFNNDSLSLPNPPISTENVKAHTKVEALVLMARDLRDVVSSTNSGRSSAFDDSRPILINVE